MITLGSYLDGLCGVGKWTVGAMSPDGRGTVVVPAQHLNSVKEHVHSAHLNITVLANAQEYFEHVWAATPDRTWVAGSCTVEQIEKAKRFINKLCGMGNWWAISSDTLHVPNAHVEAVRKYMRDSGTPMLVAGLLPPMPHVHEVLKRDAHPHAGLMAEYAKDAAECSEPWVRWEFNEVRRQGGPVEWNPCREHPNWSAYMQYRRKARTIRIGKHDVPEPFRGTLKLDTDYWTVQIGSCTAHAAQCVNSNQAIGVRHVASGLVHLSREAAQCHAEALIALSAAP